MRTTTYLFAMNFMLSMTGSAFCQHVSNSEELMAAVESGVEDSKITLGPGEYKLPRQLVLKKGMTLKGAGISKTILTHTDPWKPSPQSLPDPEMKTKNLDTSAYLIRIENKAANVTVENMQLRCPQLHGAIYGFGNENLHIHHVKIANTMWSGIRTFAMKAKIHDCEFVDAGGRWKRGGIPGDKGGITGGAIFAIWMRDSEIYNNRFWRTQQEPRNECYGIKVRKGKRCRIHHNTILVNFSIEMPFENDEDVEIDHNVLHGTVSLPKYAGGGVPQSGKTFHLHHNYFNRSYAIEFVRNGIEMDHNLFDFKTQDDGGNLISGFGKAPAKGPASFHHNLVSNPGRGVIWINEPYNQIRIHSNHIRTRTTPTPRKEGLFGFSPKCDFSTITVENNVIECVGLSRPLFRNAESYGANVKDNKLVNVADADRFKKQNYKETSPLASTLKFSCGVGGESQVDGWKFLNGKK